MKKESNKNTLGLTAAIRRRISKKRLVIMENIYESPESLHHSLQKPEHVYG